MLTRKIYTIVSDERGGVAAVFGTALMAFMLTAGLAVDYARVYRAQSQLQSDLDAAVLGSATDERGAEDPQASAQRYFDSNWQLRTGITNVVVSVSRVENRISGRATAKVPVTLMALSGIEHVDVAASTQVEIAGQNVEVALVLDTTTSMAGAKMTALQDAAKALIDTTFATPEATETVRIGIVPFAQYVNVGVANRNASWMSVAADSSVVHTQCRQTTPVIGTSNCRMQTYTGYNDGTPYTYEAEVCDYEYGPPVEDCTPWTETTTWYGCAGSRNSPLDSLDQDYATKVPGIMNAGCGAEISPLTNDADLLRSKIDGLVATGDTYIPAGLMWGWAALSPGAPFDEARPYDAVVDGLPVRKIMVLMTDGANTLYPYYPYHATEISGAQANTLTSTLCTNVKTSGIEIFTVTFEVADEDIKDIMRTCASAPNQFFDAPTPEALAEAFRNIAKGFTPLRLTQ